MLNLSHTISEKNIREAYRTVSSLLDADTAAFHITHAAAELQAETGASDDDCIRLALRMNDIFTQEDEAAFTLLDFVDAVINHPISPGIATLLSLSDKTAGNPGLWNQLIRTMARNKRDTYEDKSPNYEAFADAMVACRRAES